MQPIKLVQKFSLIFISNMIILIWVRIGKIKIEREEAMNIIALNGSPRRNGNTSWLLQEFVRGAKEAGAIVEEIVAQDLSLKFCTGCLKCNLIKQCAIRNDEWQMLSQKILEAQTLVFASPIYFHHITAPLKKVLDRFRSFMHVQITESGLKHTPWQEWHKHFILLLCLGSPRPDDAQPVIDLFKFITKELGPANYLTAIIGTRLAVVNQVKLTTDALKVLYSKLQLPLQLVDEDYQRNQQLLKQCYQLGLASGR